MSEKEKREFKGIWFPAEVWLDERLTPVEKMILMEIDSLDNKDNCYASNEHLAKFCQCSQSKVSKAISKLKSLGYVEVVSFDGRSRKLRSCLAFCTKQTSKICQSDEQNLQERVLEEFPRENTKEDKGEIPFSEVISYLNQKTGRRYKNVESTRRLIRARYGDGYTLEDFKKVIDVKCAEWLGTDFSKYLQPSTLFSASHFDEYLNTEAPRKANHGERTQRKLDLSDYGKKAGTYVVRDGKRYVYVDEERLEEVPDDASKGEHDDIDF